MFLSLCIFIVRETIRDRITFERLSAQYHIFNSHCVLAVANESSSNTIILITKYLHLIATTDTYVYKRPQAK